MKLTGNTILVTGGGTGIGEALAHQFAQRGNTVIVAGRTQETLDDAARANDAIHTMTMDVADQASVDRAVETLARDYPALNMVIHSAGVMNRNDKGDLAAAERIIGINLLGTIRIVEALIPQLSGKPNAAICTVSSGLGFVPLPTAPAYSASKAGVHSYSNHLRHRLRGDIQVVEIVPPGVQTGLTPGQKDFDGYMPLDDYIAEVMRNFEADPALRENCVEMVEPFRKAECDGKLDEMLDMLASRQTG